MKFSETENCAYITILNLYLQQYNNKRFDFLFLKNPLHIMYGFTSILLMTFINMQQGIPDDK